LTVGGSQKRGQNGAEVAPSLGADSDEENRAFRADDDQLIRRATLSNVFWIS
jgi:hypothetical protein